MYSVASALGHCALLFCCIIFMVSASADQKNISATVGESVTLPCRAPDNSIRAILWSRPDLEPKYILLYRDKQIDPEEQHPYFKSRVDLKDGQMKDGDVSLMIRNVMIFDSGTYECQVFMKGPNQRKRTADYITIINLTVVPGPTGGLTEDGSVGLKVGLSVFGILVLVVGVVVGFVIFKNTKEQKK
ncbi:hepatitis A virus cellular receptor 2 isoform X2 [Oreochromis niloticus]|uniref:hepatitis A virus cellular receptor 2 isoform X2 n=1 Tax=Oreochromis niloticus TaxID=8128 RepID=UPI0009057DC6|nr:hepatitis A virus cellular receptor 2 isoform X2 [Oreochromis niloticus]